ncbi:hypothetical protein EDF56_104108 [Novosphingobium sp. PhB165]|uniref:hypothetical protein n=1 Tax=Novosphingobium sp. PhB165 TaxID=2485105 RepID=UPI001047D336|nr:hypothetical protein [Novosphingobium sp. PhB165]TCM18578.1 hypothetical protein EDF56_104108 [Novosphingobium sp. PhB165]
MRPHATHTSAKDRERLRQAMRSNMLLLFFGLGVLGFLIAIDRAEWFSLKPATGTSVSLSHAVADHSGQTPEAPAAP